jgi:hypothetical protein
MIFPVHFHGQKIKMICIHIRGVIIYIVDMLPVLSVRMVALLLFIVYSVIHFLILISGFLNGN